jgi:predicted nucleic acid-binding Zn ribbon protein
MAKPKPIRSILDQTLRSLEIDVPLKIYSVLGAWREIVGDSVALHTQPRWIRNRILFLDVSHSTWIQQLQFLKPTLLEKINHFLGESHIQDIRFRLGKISPDIPGPTYTSNGPRGNLDKQTLERIDDILQKIADEEVRRSLREVLIRGAKLEQKRKKSK